MLINNKVKIVCILGASGSGKDTIANKTGYRIVVSHSGSRARSPLRKGACSSPRRRRAR
jgi:guanylate kinase